MDDFDGRQRCAIAASADICIWDGHWAGEGGEGGTGDQGGDIVVIWYDGEDNKRVAWGGVAVTIAFEILALPILACDVSRW